MLRRKYIGKSRMNAKKREKARAALDLAQSALHQKDRNGAYKYAKMAANFDPELEEAWLILASISDPNESVKFLNRALKINPKSPKARKGMRWAARRLRENRQGNTKGIINSSSKDTQFKKTKKEGQPKKLWRVSLFISIVSIGSVLLFWLGLPAIQAQASVQKRTRPEDALPKPTLTPTITPTPTATPEPTPTLTPTPIPPADTTYTSFHYHSWDIPEEVSGTNDFWLEVDLSNQILYAYSGNQIISSFLVSTGTSNHQTVTGAYKIYAKLPTYTMVGPGYHLSDVPYSMFFYKGYSIHGTYWHSNFGTPMSHGCVNMNTNDAAWVYNKSSIGTYVFIHY